MGLGGRGLTRYAKHDMMSAMYLAFVVIGSILVAIFIMVAAQKKR